ncbi:MAG: glutamine synthetase [Proteobacteria bacterium]|nr:glutamine synthetase [Pseudomonadota bacterium]
MLKIRNFKEIPYEELETLNLEAKADVQNHVADDVLREKYLRYLHDEKQLKAVTVCFSDLEGRFHMLDYDKKYLEQSYDGLTFDGSSIHGFSAQRESDLCLEIDWGSFRWLPSDIFGPGKVMVFGLIRDVNNQPYSGDIRGLLKRYSTELFQTGYESKIAFEVEGFLFKGIDAEQNFQADHGFDYVSDGGYFHTLPNTPLKLFIDHFAEAQRALGFENEKDHPEVAPSQFELNFRCAEALTACDEVQIYKLLARQIASINGMTASFLPKPMMKVNGSGMHANMSISHNGKNLMYNQDGAGHLSEFGWKCVDKILHHARDFCLIANSSVNSYRRLDPNFEAPNAIRVSTNDRTAIIRLPKGNEKTSRFELRSVGPDANPYLLTYTLLHLALDDYPAINAADRNSEARKLPSNIYDAIADFEKSDAMKQILGAENHAKFVHLKNMVANRSPKDLGNRIKRGEIVFHHEVTNQSLWTDF